MPGDYERCRGFIAIHVDSGTGEAADLAGMSVVFLQDAPPMMAEGGWRVGLIVDAAANDDQARRLAGIITGDLGGPFAAFAPLIGERLGIERSSIRFERTGGTTTLRAGALIDAEFADLVHEGMSDPLQFNNAALPFGPPITISPPTKSMIKAFGMEFDNSGRHGTTSEIAWSS